MKERSRAVKQVEQVEQWNKSVRQLSDENEHGLFLEHSFPRAWNERKKPVDSNSSFQYPGKEKMREVIKSGKCYFLDAIFAFFGHVFHAGNWWFGKDRANLRVSSRRCYWKGFIFPVEKLKQLSSRRNPGNKTRFSLHQNIPYPAYIRPWRLAWSDRIRGTCKNAIVPRIGNSEALVVDIHEIKNGKEYPSQDSSFRARGVSNQNPPGPIIILLICFFRVCRI